MRNEDLFVFMDYTINQFMLGNDKRSLILSID